MIVGLTVVVGILVGLVARSVLAGRRVMSVAGSALIGAGGALAAGYGGHALGLYRLGEPLGFAGAAVGAFVLVFVWSRFYT